MKKLSNRNKIEMLIGKAVILLLESLIGVGLILGFFWVLGLLFNWVEQSTTRLVFYFVVMGIIIIKMLKKEFEDQEVQIMDKLIEAIILKALQDNPKGLATRQIHKIVKRKLKLILQYKKLEEKMKKTLDKILDQMYNSIRKKERVRVKKMNNVKRKQARVRAEQMDKLKKDLREGKITKAQLKNKKKRK